MSGLLNLDDFGRDRRLAVAIGEQKVWTFTLLTDNRGASARMTFKYDKDGAADIELTSDAGEIVLGGSDKTATVTLSAAKSGTMTAGKPWFDLVIEYESGEPVQEIEGYCRFKQGVGV